MTQNSEIHPNENGRLVLNIGKGVIRLLIRCGITAGSCARGHLNPPKLE